MGLFRMRESEGMELGGNASQAMLSQRGIDVNASFRGSMQLYVSPSLLSLTRIVLIEGNWLV